MRLGLGHDLAPVQVPAGLHFGLLHRPLDDDAVFGLGSGHLDRPVQKRLVGDDPADFDAAGSRDDHLGLGVVDAGGELRGGETAEDHRVHGPQAGAGEHGDERLGDHRHVDEHPVPFGHALGRQGARKTGHFVAQLEVSEGLEGLGHGAVVDQGRLPAAAFVHMQVERVVAGVELAAGEPAVERLARVVQHLVPFLGPVALFGDLAPEAVGVLDRLGVGILIGVAHESPPLGIGSSDSRYGIRDAG